MTLTQMLYFKVVCQHMSLTKASRELHVSQPAISLAIKEIENSCGVELFYRTSNSLSITDSGVILLDEVTKILNQYQHMRQLLANNLLNRNYVRIGLSTLNGNTIFPDIIAALQKRCPEIQVFITEAGTHHNYINLDNNKVDIIVTQMKPGISLKEWEDSQIYGHIALARSSTVFAVGVDNPLANLKEIGWDEIIKERLILLNDSFNLTRIIIREMSEAGYELPNNAYYTSQVYTVERFVEKNVASGFLPARAVSDNPRLVGLKCPITRDYLVYMVYRKDRQMFMSMRQFIKTAKEILQIT